MALRIFAVAMILADRIEGQSAYSGIALLFRKYNDA
jgi:hypothetical protein